MKREKKSHKEKGVLLASLEWLIFYFSQICRILKGSAALFVQLKYSHCSHACTTQPILMSCSRILQREAALLYLYNVCPSAGVFYMMQSCCISVTTAAVLMQVLSIPEYYTCGMLWTGALGVCRAASSFHRRWSCCSFTAQIFCAPSYQFWAKAQKSCV